MLSARCRSATVLYYTDIKKVSRQYFVEPNMGDNEFPRGNQVHSQVEVPKRAGQPVRILFGNNVGAWRWRCVGAALRRTRSKGQSGVNVASNATRLVNSSGDFLTASFQPKPAPAPAAVGTTRPFQTQALGGVRESNCFLRSTDETTTAVRPVFESKTIIEQQWRHFGG